MLREKQNYGRIKLERKYFRERKKQELMVLDRIWVFRVALDFVLSRIILQYRVTTLVSRMLVLSHLQSKSTYQRKN